MGSVVLPRVYVSEGSSTTAGTTGGLSGTDFANDSYSELYMANAIAPTTFHNVATGGAAQADFDARASTVDGLMVSPGLNILTMQGMSNNIDFNGGALQDAALADLAVYLQARMAAGWYVINVTQLPRAATEYNFQRNLVNAVMRTWTGIYCHATADFAADPVVGIDSAGFDTSIIVDGTHPSFATQQVLETIIRPYINNVPVSYALGHWGKWSFR